MRNLPHVERESFKKHEATGVDQSPGVTAPLALSTPPITSYFSEPPAWMFAVLRRDGKGRALEYTPGCLHRPWCRQSCHNTGLQGEQIWCYGPWSLWEWTSAEAEWAQCGAGHQHGSHTTQQLMNCHLVQTPQLSPGQTLPSGFTFQNVWRKLNPRLMDVNRKNVFGNAHS